jgi:hypothetical protein
MRKYSEGEFTGILGYAVGNSVGNNRRYQKQRGYELT